MRVVSLGDSTSCGQGVGLRLPAERTWPALLAAGLPDAELLPLAQPGARVRDVVEHQVPEAVAARPQLTTLLVGLNDVARGGFHDGDVRRDLQGAVLALVESGASVLLGRLHDPGARLPLPPALRREVRRRTDVVNAAVDVVGLHPRVHVLDLGALRVLRVRAGFEHDRLHPSALAHHALATAAARLLDAPGPAGEPPAADRLGLLGQGVWLVRHALPWLLSHPSSVVLPAVRACLP